MPFDPCDRSRGIVHYFKDKSDVFCFINMSVCLFFEKYISLKYVSSFKLSVLVSVTSDFPSPLLSEFSGFASGFKVGKNYASMIAFLKNETCCELARKG